MEEITCPHCSGTMYSVSFQIGKLVCVYCKREFLVEKKGDENKNDIKSY